MLCSRNAELCIDNKCAQLLSAAPEYFRTFRKEILQGIEIPKHLTRIEFRFMCQMLERYGITIFTDLKNSQSILPKVFGRDGFRILERSKVRRSVNHSQRSDLGKNHESIRPLFFRCHLHQPATHPPTICGKPPIYKRLPNRRSL